MVVIGPNRYKYGDKERKFSWTGHTLRKDDDQPSKVALQRNPQENRGRGRP
jgi:hypothetical protein